MYSGSSALHSASGRGLLPLVRTLVRSGADSGLKNCHNDTPLMVARSRRVSKHAGCGGGLQELRELEGWGLNEVGSVPERRSAGMGQMSGTCVQGMRQCACAHKCQGVEASRCSLTRGCKF